jgi:hypothetical protein
MPIVIQDNDDRQRNNPVILISADLADPLMPRTQPDTDLDPSLFLGPINLDLNGYHSRMSAEWGIKRLINRAKVVGLTSQPF